MAAVLLSIPSGEASLRDGMRPAASLSAVGVDVLLSVVATPVVGVDRCAAEFNASRGGPLAVLVMESMMTESCELCLCFSGLTAGQTAARCTFLGTNVVVNGQCTLEDSISSPRHLVSFHTRIKASIILINGFTEVQYMPLRIDPKMHGIIGISWETLLCQLDVRGRNN